MPRTVIVVHGVGRAAPAVVGSAVAHTLGFGPARQATVYQDGHSLVEIEEEVSKNAVVEVNWSDLLRPEAVPISIVRHLWYIISSMVDVATSPSPGYSFLLANAYRIALFTFTPGLVALTLATVIAVSLPLWWQRSVVLSSLLVGFVLLTLWLQKQGRHFRWLWLWLAPLVTILAIATLKPLRATDWIIETSGTVRTIGFTAVVLLMTLAAAQGWLGLRGKPREVKLAYTALLYMPFIAVNSLMAWLAFLGLSAIRGFSNGGYSEWEAAVVSGAARQIYPQMEAAATLVIGLIGALAIFLPLVGYAMARRGRTKKSVNRKGRGAQNGLRAFLIVAPLLLLSLGLFCVWAWYSHVQVFPVPPDVSIIEIYRTSVWRTLPFLAWLVGPFAVALDAIGDVVFYIQPNEKHPAAIGEICRSRLRAALRYAQLRQADVTVLAHSQGSVIAADLRASRELGAPLVTIGCPLGSLYGRFLDRIPESEAGQDLGVWCNAYRDGDVIAGPVEGASNTNLGPGGHTGYWLDKNLKVLLQTASS